MNPIEPIEPIPEADGEPEAAPIDAPAAPAPPRAAFAATSIPFAHRILLLPTLLFFIFALGPIFERIRACAGFPYEIDGEEGFVFNQAADMFFGRSIYTPIDQPPYLVGNYPPVFPWLVSRLMRAETFGLPFARVMVLSFALAVINLSVLHVFWRTRRVLPALLAPLLFLVSYESNLWLCFVRVDIPALAFTMAGLFIFLNGEAPITAAVAGLLFAAAGFTKQTAVLAPAACIVGMLLHDRPRLHWFLPAYVGAGLLGLAWLNLATRGEFWRHTVVYNANAMDWSGWRRVMANEIWFFQGRWLATLAAGAVSLAAAMRFARGEAAQAANALNSANPDSAAAPSPTFKARFAERPHTRGVVGVYAVLATLSLASMAKIGSAPNYVLEPLLAWSIFGMETLGRLFDMGGGAPGDRRRWARLGALAMAVGLILHAVNLRGKTRELFSPRNPTQADADAGRALTDLAVGADGPILSEFAIPLLQARKDVFLQPFIMSRLAREGKWDERPIVEGIRAHAFPLIITSQDLREAANGAAIDRWTPAMIDKIMLYYKLDRVIRSNDPRGLRQPYFIWKPSPAKKENQQNLGREALFRITEAAPHRV